MTAPNTMNVAASKSSPPSSTSLLTCPPASWRRAPNAKPPVNAAMKMLPPSALAMPAASNAEAAVRICLQCGSISSRRVEKRNASAPTVPAGMPPSSPYPICSSTRFVAACPEDVPGVGLGDRDRDEEDRDAEPVVEAALDVEALSDAGRDALIGDDRLAQRGVRAGEHDREHGRLRDADPGDHQRAHQGAGDDREREADAQQPQRHRELPTERAQRDPRGIREQHERQRDLRQQLDLLAFEPEV